VKKRVATVNKKISASKILKQGILISLALLFVFTLPVAANNGDVLSDYMEEPQRDENTNGVENPDYDEDPDDNNEDEEIEISVVERTGLWQDSMIADRPPSRLVGNLQLRGVFPDIQPDFGPTYTALNADISDAASALIDTALRLRARTITFSYEVFTTSEVVSVVMYASVAAVTTREIVATVNFHPITGVRLSVACVMGADFPALVDRELSDWARRYPERHYAAILAPVSAFYMTDEKIVILFDEFQVSTVAGSLTYMEFRLENIVRVRIAPIQYNVRPEIYNLKMVPVAFIVSALGYYPVLDLTYGPRVRIWRNSNHTGLVSELRMGVNSFSWNDSIPRTLETWPRTNRGTTLLVPITFFDRIMPRVTYRVDAEGYIHFLSYRR